MRRLPLASRRTMAKRRTNGQAKPDLFPSLQVAQICQTVRGRIASVRWMSVEVIVMGVAVVQVFGRPLVSEDRTTPKSGPGWPVKPTMQFVRTDEKR